MSIIKYKKAQTMSYSRIKFNFLFDLHQGTNINEHECDKNVTKCKNGMFVGRFLWVIGIHHWVVLFHYSIFHVVQILQRHKFKNIFNTCI